MKKKLAMVLAVAMLITTGSILVVVVLNQRSNAKELQQRVVDLETQIEALKPSASIVPFCDSINRFFSKADVATRQYGARIGSKETWPEVPQTVRDEYSALVSQSNAITISLPPPGAPPEAKKVYDMVRVFQAATDRTVSAVYSENQPAINAAFDQRQASKRDIDAYMARVCPSG